MEQILYNHLVKLRVEAKNSEEHIYLEKQLEKYEEILKKSDKRFVILPIKYHEVWRQYKSHEAVDWVAEDIRLDKDFHDWNTKLNADERWFITYILAFFASFDGIVNENLTERFMSEVQIPEARAFYAFQIRIETVHSEVYSRLIEAYVSDPTEQEKVFNALEHFPSIRKMADWAMKWTQSDLPFNRRILAYTCIEGIMFSGPFSAIYWLKKRGLMAGLTHSNELISRDEGLHMAFGVLIHNLLKYPADNDTIIEIVSETVALCHEFISESLPCSLIGMNQKDMNTYIEFVADRLLTQLSVPKIYNVSNPFVGWMELISMENKTNFFEKPVAEYNKATTNYGIINKTSTGGDVKNSELLEDF